MECIRFEVAPNSERIPDVKIRDSIITNKWIGEDEDLSLVRRVSEGLCIADHPSIEDDFSHGIALVSETVSDKCRTILQKKRSSHIVV